MSAAEPGFWTRRPVLVTGATGFLGGWIVKALLDRETRVVALVRDSVPHCMFAREGLGTRTEVVQGALEDFDTLRRVCAEYEIGTILHLAAQSIVGVAKTDPLSTLETNVRGTWNLLEAARQTAVREIVVASSDKAYGPSEDLPYREEHPMQGRYPYDVSKSCVDLVCRMYAETYELPVCVTRCGNLYGGGDLNWSRTVPGVIRATHHGERFVIRSDGKFVRDFLYVRDAADAYLLLARRMNADHSLWGQAFNFSLELRLSVLDLTQKILEMMKREDLEPVIQNSASSELREQYMSAEKAPRILRWSPRYGLDRGLEETIAWYTHFWTQTASPPTASAGS
jgi:CDP-glucose 4,6-dehydratase